MVMPSPNDKVTIDGVKLTATSGLQALRTALTGLCLSTSGSKQKCFGRLLSYQKKHELEVLQSAVAKNQQDVERKPNAQPLHIPTENPRSSQSVTLPLPAVVLSLRQSSSSSRCTSQHGSSETGWHSNGEL